MIGQVPPLPIQTSFSHLNGFEANVDSLNQRDPNFQYSGAAGGVVDPNAPRANPNRLSPTNPFATNDGQNVFSQKHSGPPQPGRRQTRVEKEREKQLQAQNEKDQDVGFAGVIQQSNSRSRLVKAQREAGRSLTIAQKQQAYPQQQFQSQISMPLPQQQAFDLQNQNQYGQQPYVNQSTQGTNQQFQRPRNVSFHGYQEFQPPNQNLGLQQQFSQNEDPFQYAPVAIGAPKMSAPFQQMPQQVPQQPFQPQLNTMAPSSVPSGVPAEQNFNRPSNQFVEWDPEKQQVQEDQKASLMSDLEIQIQEKKKQKEEEKRKQLEEERRFEEKIERDRQEMAKQEEVAKKKAKEQDDQAERLNQDLLNRKRQEQIEKEEKKKERLLKHKQYQEEQQILESSLEKERNAQRQPEPVEDDFGFTAKNVTVTPANKAAIPTPARQSKAEVAPKQLEELQYSFKEDVREMKDALEQQDESFNQQFNQLLAFSIKQEKERAGAQKELRELRKQIEMQREEHLQTQWDLATRSAHFRFDAIKKEYPLETIDQVATKHSIEAADDILNLNLQHAEPQRASNAFMTPAPKSKKALQTDLLDFEAIDDRYPSRSSSKMVDLNGYFGAAASDSRYPKNPRLNQYGTFSANQILAHKLRTPSRDHNNRSRSQFSAGPRSGQNPYDNNTFQSSQLLDNQNKPLHSEVSQANGIREKNIERLSNLQQAAKYQIEQSRNERQEEFANIRPQKRLSDYDSSVYKLLTPEPPRSKSFGLLNAGNHVVSQNHLGVKPRDQALQQIEENYAENLFDEAVYDNPYNGTILIK